MKKTDPFVEAREKCVATMAKARSAAHASLDAYFDELERQSLSHLALYERNVSAETQH